MPVGAAGGFRWFRPLLAFADCVSSVVTRRLLPPSSGDRRGCTPGLARRQTVERSWLPTSAASWGRRAPGGAAGERVPRPSPRGERARRVVQRAVYRAPLPRPLPRSPRGTHVGRADGSGIVDSTLSTFPVVRRALRRRSPPTRPGLAGPPRAVDHVEPCWTPLMAGSQRLPLRRHPRRVSTPSALSPPTERGAHLGGQAILPSRPRAGSPPSKLGTPSALWRAA